jgi:hypothetical protein
MQWRMGRWVFHTKMLLLSAVPAARSFFQEENKLALYTHPLTFPNIKPDSFCFVDMCAVPQPLGACR